MRVCVVANRCRPGKCKGLLLVDFNIELLSTLAASSSKTVIHATQPTNQPTRQPTNPYQPINPYRSINPHQPIRPHANQSPHITKIIDIHHPQYKEISEHHSLLPSVLVPTEHARQNWTVADPSLGGAPPLLIPKFELRVLAVAPGVPASSPDSNDNSNDNDDDDDDGRSDDADDDADGRGSAAGNRVDTVKDTSGGNSGKSNEAVAGGGDGVPGGMLSAAVVETHPLDSDENGLSMALVRLEQGGSPRMYVAVGTGMNDAQGEDKAVSG